MMAYERFKAWHCAHALALGVFRETDGWPRREMYGLTAQIRRAALSVPTNIAEGAAKRGRREFARYLDIAFGSLSEVSYLLRFSLDRGLLTPAQWTALEEVRSETGRLIFGLSRRMRQTTESAQPP
jgi:four helix bundle protein